jgi:HD-GYP domain-containing protein (c-di-GMP phosphodiesterase class II)
MGQGPICHCGYGCGQPSLLCVVIEQAQQVYGYLLVSGAAAMDDEEIRLLVQLAGDIALSLRGLAAQAKLRRAVETTIDVLGVVGESRDPYTAGHQRRVTQLAVAIGEELGLSVEQIETIRFASAIHDIGKLSVPGEILSKPSALAPLEMALVRQHPELGATILRSVETPWPLAEVILQHHERLDGSGYPYGLTADQICIEARVMAVADVVEAMANHRPYRPALGLDRALREVENNAGVLYDAAVVAACGRVFRQGGFSLSA